MPGQEPVQVCGALSRVLGKRNWCIQNWELFPAPFLTPFPADRPVKAPGRQQLVANQNSPPRFWKRGVSDNVHGALALALALALTLAIALALTLAIAQNRKAA